MLDIKFFRENIDEIRRKLSTKKFDVDFDAILDCDSRRRAIVGEFEAARSAQNSANKEMAAMKKGSPEFLAKVAEMKAISATVKELEKKAAEIEEEWRALYLTVPNIPDESVPVGKTEADNEVVYAWGDPEKLVSKNAVPHWDISWFEKAIDFKRGVKVTGAGFPFYVGDLARLLRGLINFCLEEAHAAGYEEVMPPIVVNPASATATGQLPDKEGQMYHAPEDDFYLIPTAEVPVPKFFSYEI